MAASGVGETLVASLPWDAAALSDVLGERSVRNAVSAAGQKLGAVLAHLVAVLDIHRIVVALELENAEDELLRAVRAEVKARVLPSLASVVDFSSSQRGGDLVLAGAAALVLSEQLGVVWQ
jgi:predicted NBD/HSP70 family sugar kinase